MINLETIIIILSEATSLQIPIDPFSHPDPRFARSEDTGWDRERGSVPFNVGRYESLA